MEAWGHKKTQGSRNGYRFIDFIDENDQKIYRVKRIIEIVGKKDASAYNIQIRLKENPNYDLNIYRDTLSKTLSTGPLPRYGVTYEDHVIPEERAIGVASSTVKIIDLENNEVLGEIIRYAYRPHGVNFTDWLHLNTCPRYHVHNDSFTRKFVDQVLIPKAE